MNTIVLLTFVLDVLSYGNRKPLGSCLLSDFQSEYSFGNFCRPRRRRVGCFPGFPSCSSSSSSSYSDYRGSRSCSRSSEHSSSSRHHRRSRSCSRSSEDSSFRCKPRRRCFPRKFRCKRRNASESVNKEKSAPIEKSKNIEELQLIGFPQINELISSILDGKCPFLDGKDGIVSKLDETQIFTGTATKVDTTSPDFLSMVEKVATTMEQEIFDLIIENLVTRYKNKAAVQVMFCEEDPVIVNLKINIRNLIKKTSEF